MLLVVEELVLLVDALEVDVDVDVLELVELVVGATLPQPLSHWLDKSTILMPIKIKPRNNCLGIVVKSYYIRMFYANKLSADLINFSVRPNRISQIHANKTKVGHDFSCSERLTGPIVAAVTGIIHKCLI